MQLPLLKFNAELLRSVLLQSVLVGARRVADFPPQLVSV
jgi:hypothetical protein